jgi:hypothetical protein
MRVLLISCLLAAGAVVHAAPAGNAGFLQEKTDILLLAAERLRQAPDDAQRAVKTGENNLRRLHASYKIAGSTPPTTLDGDVKELTSRATLQRLQRSRGKSPSPDPRIYDIISNIWNRYRADLSMLAETVDLKRDQGLSENRIYWETTKDLTALQDDTRDQLIHNTPEGERSLDDAFARDRWEMLRRLEDPKRIQGRSGCVKSPEETGAHPAFDAAPFYRAAGMLPGVSPRRKTAYELPEGCRTVTQREPGAKMIIRAKQGKGIVFIGDQRVTLAYDYVVVPPETAYIIENPGPHPLAIEAIALNQ